MSLPPHFEIPSDYFEASLELFRNYQHLYNFPNTKILINNVLDQISITGLEEIDVFEENIKLEHLSSNEDIKSFLEAADKLTVKYNRFENNGCENRNWNVPLGPKKKHEILYLAQEIEELCEKSGCKTVVDFGAGLGYLDQLIFEKSKYKVLGLECNQQHHIGAKKRQRKYHEDSIENVKYIKHTVANDSQNIIGNHLKEAFGDCGVFCIAGLHACADLTIDAMNLFLKMEDAKSIILMSCCYHRLRLNMDKFVNFPLSECLKYLVEKWNDLELLTVPFLRLAAQPPSSKDNLKDSVFNLMSRAVLELYSYKNNYKLARKKRKAVNTKNLDNDFGLYVRNAISNGFLLLCNSNTCPNASITENQDETSRAKCECSLSFDLEELIDIWRHYCNDLTFKKAAIFVLLQRRLQPMFEHFILYDRKIYLLEQGLVNCEIKKIVDASISPRCLALIASK